ncbi:MAG TPA: MFS transporter [Candidatus Limnocylindrales bacterium]|nr:MFS transporter [Candidatus Limnocylindrales bacterium]
MPLDPARRALILTCLYAAATGTDYTNHGPVLDVISREFGLSDASAGAMATAFFAGSAATMLLGGSLADRFGARLMVTLGFALVVISNIGCGLLAPSYPILLAWRVVGGIGTGISFPAGSAYLTQTSRSGGSHFALGLYGAGFLLGSASTFLFMPALAGPGHDWRLAYVVSGLGVGLCFLFWLAWAPRVPKGATSGLRASKTGSSGSGLRAAMSVRNSWLLALCHTCGFGLAMILGTWVTSFLTRDFGLGLALAGGLGSLVLVMGIVGRFGGGVAVERGLPPFLVIRASLAVCALGLLAMALAGDQLWLALAGVVVTGLAIGLPYASLFDGAAASAPSSPASAQALVGWGGTMVAVVGPPLVGGLLDLTGGFPAGFTTLAVFSALVLLSTWLLRPFGGLVLAEG